MNIECQYGYGSHDMVAEKRNNLARAAPALGPGPPPVPGVAAPVARVRSVSGSPVAAPAAGPGPAPLVATAPAAPAHKISDFHFKTVNTLFLAFLECLNVITCGPHHHIRRDHLRGILHLRLLRVFRRQ